MGINKVTLAKEVNGYIYPKTSVNTVEYRLESGKYTSKLEVIE